MIVNNELKGCGRKCPVPEFSLRDSEKPLQTIVRAVVVQAEIRTGQLPNTNQKR
jgi:hypothetical protein